MEFTNDTQFPVFTKHKHYYCCYPNKDFYMSLDKNFGSISNSYAEKGLLEEAQITKQEFIEANKDFLQKTGLINLFGDPENDSYKLSVAKDRINQLVSENLQLKELKEENNELRAQRNVAKENQIYYENINSELESEIFELKSLLKRYL